MMRYQGAMTSWFVLLVALFFVVDTTGIVSKVKVLRRLHRSRFALLTSGSEDDGLIEARRLELREKLLEKADLFSEKRMAGLMAEDAPKAKGLFGAESRGTATVSIDEDAQKVIDYIEEIAKMNPTPEPLKNWVGYKDGGLDRYKHSELDGMWKLRFTTATDATFKPGKRGKATTMQYINGTEGTFTNVIDFKENKGKVIGFRVVVEGKPINGTAVDLNFKKVIIERRSKVPFLFGKITIPLPSLSILQKLGGSKDKNGNKSRGAFFNIVYLDDEMRIHITGDGNYFVQTRLYEAWDPMVGWKYITAT